MILEVIGSIESELTSPQQIKSYRQYKSVLICSLDLCWLTELAASLHLADICGEIFSLCEAIAEKETKKQQDKLIYCTRVAALEIVICKILA